MLADQVRVWNRDQRGGPAPSFALWPMSTPDERLPDGLVITKRYHRVTISWPPAVSAAGGQNVPHQPTEQGE